MVGRSEEPVLAELSIRLRTLDLALAESLRSAPDGRFVSTLEFPRGRLLARVQDDEGNELADQEASFDPAETEDWRVGIRWRTTARGRVLDLGGEPVSGASLRFDALGSPPRTLRESSDRDGRFELRAPGPGAFRLEVESPWARLGPLRVDLQRGPNSLGELVLPQTPRAGAIRGRLVTEALDQGLSANVLLFDGQEREVRSVVLTRPAGGVSAEFAFEDVPAGPYRVRVISVEGLCWAPPEQLTSPPAELEFRALPRRRCYEVLATDARSGARIPAPNLLLRTQGRWVVEGQPGSCERWIVHAEGYRAASGDPDAFRPAEAAGALACERWVLEVALEPGWSLPVLIHEASIDREDVGLYGRPLADAEVRGEGGVLLGRTAADGMALLDLAGPPGALEFRCSGYSTSEVSLGHPGLVLMSRE